MENKYKLFLDTTQKNLYITLMNNTKVLVSKNVEVERKHADLAVNEVAKILINKKLKVNDLSEVYIANGPGSYTGCRIGLTIAKIWNAINPKIKIFTISSLLLQAGHKSVVSVIDAKSNLFFCAVYKNAKIVRKPALVNQENLNKIILKYSKYKLVSDYQNVNINEHFESLIEHFEAHENALLIKPFYLKKAI